MKGSLVNRVELECQVLCAALRQSWVRRDKVGTFTSIRELSHLFPDLLPPPEDKSGTNKADYYDVLQVRAQAGLNSIVVGYLRTVRKFLKTQNAKENKVQFNTMLNAGFVLRKPRLRLSHDLVVARRWLYDTNEEAAQEPEPIQEAAYSPPAPITPPPPPPPPPVPQPVQPDITPAPTPVEQAPPAVTFSQPAQEVSPYTPPPEPANAETAPTHESYKQAGEIARPLTHAAALEAWGEDEPSNTEQPVSETPMPATPPASEIGHPVQETPYTAPPAQEAPYTPPPFQQAEAPPQFTAQQGVGATEQETGFSSHLPFEAGFGAPSEQGGEPSFASPAQEEPYTPPYTAPQEPYTSPLQESYTPPVQEPYTPPVQEPYTPPLQEPYTPPLQEPYTPPVQEPYTPPYTPAQEPYAPPAQPVQEPAYTPVQQEPYTPPAQEAPPPQPVQPAHAPVHEAPYSPPVQESTFTAPPQPVQQIPTVQQVPISQSAPQSVPSTPPAASAPRPASQAPKEDKFVFDESKLHKPDSNVQVPAVIRLLEAAHLITSVEVQALKNQMLLAPNIPAEQLVMNAGYASPTELASLRFAQDLLAKGRITMAQFQVAMYDERTSGLRMVESLQVRGWLETEVKNSLEKS